jgi:signal transduction histidine kinase
MFLNKVHKKILLLKRMTAVRQASLLTVVFLFILLIAALSVTWLLNKELSDSVDNELATRHKVLTKSMLDTPQQLLNLPDSPLFFASLKVNKEKTVGLKHPKLFRSKGYSTIDLPSHDDWDTWRIYTAPTSLGMLSIGINTDNRYELLEKVGELFLIVGLFTALSTLIIGLYIGIKNQRRFSAINQTLDKVSAGDLGARIAPLHNRDDLDQVALQIDETNVRLESLLQQTKDLTSNIAHDLKTPMARLRAKLENVLSADQPEKIDETIESALDQTDQMIATFEAILRIAHLSSGQYRQRFKVLSLVEVVQETADIYRAVLEDSGYHFNLVLDSQCQIRGDRELIIQLIANLLENALRHTERGSQINLECTGAKLTVSDNGPGIDADLRSKVLEPMYRLDASRNTKGNGLGLSLVDTIAKLHSACIELSDTNPSASVRRGLCVTLLFAIVLEGSHAIKRV